MALFSSLRFSDDFKIPRAVKLWLVAGLVMIFMQIVIGGITRLTGSGLSITKWEIVTGAVPPLSEAAWEEAFQLYQQTPQYHRINQGMTLDAFKFIYFWEYFHRLWARLMFFVFIIPFGWFLSRGMFSRRLLPRLVVVVLLAGLEGFFGWIMVASGLIQRPWVNAYNLTLHLVMALIIFSYLLWTTFIAFLPEPGRVAPTTLRRHGWAIVFLLFVQLALGAMMSGTKAGLVYPTWPDMGGSYLPSVILDGSMWTSESFIHYDTNPFVPALVQFFHRNVAYLLTIMMVYFIIRSTRLALTPRIRAANRILIGVLGLQLLLGIFTVINCLGKVPVDLGVAHQAGAVLLLSAFLYSNYLISGKSVQE